MHTGAWVWFLPPHARPLHHSFHLQMFVFIHKATTGASASEGVAGATLNLAAGTFHVALISQFLTEFCPARGKASALCPPGCGRTF